ncbi:MAG: 8-oxo-dGTP diphosphatase [Turicibacter sp.]|nr:8-oxo-dGTP diphosphatase [Turicibacter sp.]
MLETTLCYIFKNSEILMLYRNKKENDVHEGKWNGLGGKLEKEETPLQCVLREVYEESGLRLVNPTLIGACHYPNFNNSEELMYVYIADEFEGQPLDCNEGDLHWRAKDEIMTLNIWESDRLFLPYVLNKQYFIGCFQYDEFDFVSGDCEQVNLTKLEQFIRDKKNKL